jgi:hypothetical protein
MSNFCETLFQVQDKLLKTVPFLESSGSENDANENQKARVRSEILLVGTDCLVKHKVLFFTKYAKKLDFITKSV